jgi:hypothetical protein
MVVNAMEQANMEPVIIEDLVYFGEDRGHLAEARVNLRRVLALRKLPLSSERERQIDACTDIEALHRWLDQAIFAESAGEALR